MCRLSCDQRKGSWFDILHDMVQWASFVPICQCSPLYIHPIHPPWLFLFVWSYCYPITRRTYKYNPDLSPPVWISRIKSTCRLLFCLCEYYVKSCLWFSFLITHKHESHREVLDNNLYVHNNNLVRIGRNTFAWLVEVRLLNAVLPT